MNTITFLYRFSFFILFLSLTISCDDDDNNNVLGVENPRPLIYDVLRNNENTYGTLLAALEKADLENEIRESGRSVTLLAPTNEAFNQFLDGRTLDDFTAEQLESVLLYHIVPGNLDVDQVTDDMSVYASTSAQGPNDIDDNNTQLSMLFSTTNDQLIVNGGSANGGAAIRLTDTIPSNGVLHQVDRILLRPTLNTFLNTDSSLSELKSLVETTFTTGIFETENTPFTFFAPIDTAVEAQRETLNTLSEEQVRKLLQQHVVTKQNVIVANIASLAEGQTAATLLGDDFKLTLDAAEVTVTNGPTTAKIDQSQTIQTDNGVLHRIDTVLIPENL